jgi:hypothetical protein
VALAFKEPGIQFKAYLRRGMARKFRGFYAQGAEDARAALGVTPGSGEAKALLEECERRHREIHGPRGPSQQTQEKLAAFATSRAGRKPTKMMIEEAEDCPDSGHCPATNSVPPEAPKPSIFKMSIEEVEEDEEEENETLPEHSSIRTLELEHDQQIDRTFAVASTAHPDVPRPRITQLPDIPPIASPIDMERHYKACKQDSTMMLHLLQSVQPVTRLPSLLVHWLDADALWRMVMCVHSATSSTGTSASMLGWAAQVVQQLALYTPRVSMLLHFFKPQDVQVVRELLARLHAQWGQGGVASLGEIQRALGLKGA